MYDERKEDDNMRRDTIKKAVHSNKRMQLRASIPMKKKRLLKTTEAEYNIYEYINEDAYLDDFDTGYQSDEFITEDYDG